jgi:hypothetical protein
VRTSWRASTLLFAVAAGAGCLVSPYTPVQLPEAASPASEADRLFAIVLAAPHPSDPCVAGPLYGAVDDESAGRELERVLDAGPGEGGLLSVRRYCFDVAAAARLLRLERLGRADLGRDLIHPSFAVRRAALLRARLVEGPAAGPRIRAALSDVDAGVRAASYRALAQLKDTEARPLLEEAMGRETDAQARSAACGAIVELGGQCVRQAALGGLRGGSADDRCLGLSRQLEASDGAQQHAALWRYLVDGFDAARAPLEGRTPSNTLCRASGAAIDRLLEHRSPPLTRAFAAALTLWAHHPDLTAIPRDRAIPGPRPFSTFAPIPALHHAPPGPGGGGECFTDFDCGGSGRCLKPAGGLTLMGVCGRLVDAMGMPKIGVDRRASGCTVDTDCPPFFSCRKINGIDGVCARR